MSESIEWVCDAERFAAIRDDWERLADLERTPFVRHAWLASWWAAFGNGRLRICALWEDGELAALFPLHATPSGLAGLTNEHTPLFRPLARGRRQLERVIDEVLDQPYDLRVEALPADHLALEVLTERCATRGRRLLVVLQHTSPIAETADYASRLSSKTARELGRLRRKMEREHRAELSLLRRPPELEPELQLGFEVEASGWKGRRGTAILSSPRTDLFYRLIARAFHDADRLRLSTIRLDGQVAAFDLCLLDNGRMYGVKFGYDEQFRHLAPGLVLQHGEIERCCELGLDAFELLGDDEEYKRRFSTAKRPHYSLRAYTGGPVSLARYGYRRGVWPILRRTYRSLPAKARNLRPRARIVR
ncbi:MAG: GNAT family N-acetyltransferase [Gaiellaceae bacterium MAG52_C11]|nr:GNAT family N-acetyltransferase [Candidatus Gaiellasilicea maunaloa]